MSAATCFSLFIDLIILASLLTRIQTFRKSLVSSPSTRIFCSHVSGFEGCADETLPTRNAHTFPQGAETFGRRFELNSTEEYNWSSHF